MNMATWSDPELDGVTAASRYGSEEELIKIGEIELRDPFQSITSKDGGRVAVRKITRVTALKRQKSRTNSTADTDPTDPESSDLDLTVPDDNQPRDVQPHSEEPEEGTIHVRETDNNAPRQDYHRAPEGPDGAPSAPSNGILSTADSTSSLDTPDTGFGRPHESRDDWRGRSNDSAYNSCENRVNIIASELSLMETRYRSEMKRMSSNGEPTATDSSRSGSLKRRLSSVNNPDYYNHIWRPIREKNKEQNDEDDKIYWRAVQRIETTKTGSKFKLDNSTNVGAEDRRQECNTNEHQMYIARETRQEDSDIYYKESLEKNRRWQTNEEAKFWDYSPADENVLSKYLDNSAIPDSEQNILFDQDTTYKHTSDRMHAECTMGEHNNTVRRHTHQNITEDSTKQEVIDLTVNGRHDVDGSLRDHYTRQIHATYLSGNQSTEHRNSTLLSHATYLSGNQSTEHRNSTLPSHATYLSGNQSTEHRNSTLPSHPEGRPSEGSAVNERLDNGYLDQSVTVQTRETRLFESVTKQNGINSNKPYDQPRALSSPRQGDTLRTEQLLAATTNDHRHSTSISNRSLNSDSQLSTRLAADLTDVNHSIENVRHDLSLTAELTRSTPSELAHQQEPGTEISWRAPDLPEVVEYLSYHDNIIKHNAAAYLQHLSYMNDSVKEEIRKLRGIPSLLDIINSGNPELDVAVCGTLRNLSHGSGTDETKREIVEAGGVPIITRLLSNTRDVRLNELITAVLWNITSVQVAKKHVVEESLSILVETSLLPLCIRQPDGDQTHNVTCSPLLRNTTGVLRNLSSESNETRVRMRNCQSLVECLLSVVEQALDKPALDNRCVENCVCVLCNLSYPCPDERRTEHRKRQKSGKFVVEETREKAGCFSLKKSSKTSNQRTKPSKQSSQLPVTAGRSEAAVGVLWTSRALSVYLSVISQTTNAVTMEGAIGAIQNLCHCHCQLAESMRQSLHSLKGLPVLVELLYIPSDQVVCTCAAALRNLVMNAENRRLLAKHAVRQIVYPLSVKSGFQASDKTLCALLTLIYNIVVNNPDCARQITEEGGTERLMYIAHSEKYQQKPRKYASVILTVMWQFTELHPLYGQRGWKMEDFIKKSSVGKSRKVKNSKEKRKDKTVPKGQSQQTDDLDHRRQSEKGHDQSVRQSYDNHGLSLSDDVSQHGVDNGQMSSENSYQMKHLTLASKENENLRDDSYSRYGLNEDHQIDLSGYGYDRQMETFKPQVVNGSLHRDQQISLDSDSNNKDTNSWV